ncbi:MAG: excinuclease ABC subunit UvrC [Candidatus Levybacteria bacterium]|nr:excinuclease ABC subunit UvrC [Candidatus Levybacteria bacterium]
MSQYLLSEFRSISSNPGIYLFLDKKNNVLYIGKAKNLKKRVGSYFIKNVSLGPKTQKLVSSIHKIRTIDTLSEIEAFLLEANYIKKFSPKYNSRLTDGKAFPLVKITIKDKYPKILITRRTDDPSAIYFGPYPNAFSMRLVLRTIRKIFPFQSVTNHPSKNCLYYHIGICPCPYVNDSEELRKEYLKSINHIIDFLNGKIKKVINDLKRDRDKASNDLEFERANSIQEKIDAIIISTDPATRLFEKNIDPNLEKDKAFKSINKLLSEFRNHNIPIKDLRRIECYDISNISGQFATGSMAVFANGEKNTSLYRKFKIRFNSKPDDFAMLKEMVARRLTHKEWQIPSLIVVDGGKGQVSVIAKLLKDLKLNIPLIGLAKREEEIVTSNLNLVKISKNSPALHLLMRIRDEAHRFALSYHRKLRLKNLTL